MSPVFGCVFFPPPSDDMGVSIIRHARTKVLHRMQRPWLLSSWPLLTSSRRCWSTRNSSNEEGTKSPLFPPKKELFPQNDFLVVRGFCGKQFQKIWGYLWLLSSEVKWFDFHICSVFRPLGEASWQEHQQAVEEEFGPENFVVVVRGLLDEAREVVEF